MNTTSSPTAEPEQLAAMPEGQISADDLLSRLATQSGLDLSALLAAQGIPGSDGITDPLQELALRLLEQHMAAPPPESDMDTSDEDEEQRRLDEIARLSHQQRRMTELKRVLTSLYAEIESLRLRNDAVAAALGACYLCFGDDPDCPECGGNGVPGSLAPDIPAFRQYVVPAVTRMRSTPRYRPVHAAPGGKEENGHHDSSRSQPPDDPTT